MSSSKWETINGSRYPTEWNNDAHNEETDERLSCEAIGHAISTKATKKPISAWPPQGNPSLDRIRNSAEKRMLSGRLAQPKPRRRARVRPIEKRPASSREMWIEANRHFRSGNYGDASEAYGVAMYGINQKDRVTILSNRAECYLRMGKNQQAKSDLENALKLNPAHTKSLSRLKRCGGKKYTSCSEARAKRDGDFCCLSSMSLRFGGNPVAHGR